MCIIFLNLCTANAVFASCPYGFSGCTGDPIPLSAQSGSSVDFDATVIHVGGGSCGFKQEIYWIELYRINIDSQGNKLEDPLLNCIMLPNIIFSNHSICPSTYVTKDRVSLDLRWESSSTTQHGYVMTLSNVGENDAGLYEARIHTIKPPDTMFETRLRKFFQLQGNLYIPTTYAHKLPLKCMSIVMKIN